MKSIILTAYLLMTIIISQSIHAQPIERFIKSKARVATSRAAERTDDEIDKQINKSVDKGIDNLLDKVAGEDEEKNTSPDSSSPEGNPASTGKQGASASEQARTNAFLKSLGMDAPVNVSETYNYKGYILMDIEIWDTDGNKESTSNYSTYYNESARSFAMEFTEPDKGKSLIIFDAENKMMIILSDDGNEKTGIVTPLNYEDSAEYTTEATTSELAKDDSEYDGFNPNYKKTGRTKNISGYSCEEYLYEDEESELRLWVTKDLPADLYTRMFSLSAFASLSYAGYGNGFTMEWDYKQKNSKERSIMTVKEVDKNKQTTIKTGGYNLISLGGMMQKE